MDLQNKCESTFGIRVFFVVNVVIYFRKNNKLLKAADCVSILHTLAWLTLYLYLFLYYVLKLFQFC